MRVVIRQPGKLQREISFDGRVEIGWTLWIDIEAAVCELARQNRRHGSFDSRAGGWIPGAVHRRMQPELQQDVVRLERGVGRELTHPVAELILRPEKIVDCPLRGFGCYCQ